MKEFLVRTPAREALVDITSQVENVIREAWPTLSGLVHIFVPHTTAGITINEGADPSVARDILETLARLIPRNGPYQHREGNSDAHVKASLLGSSVTCQAKNGQLLLGTWQAIYLAEFDGPRTRRVLVTAVSSD